MIGCFGKGEVSAPSRIGRVIAILIVCAAVSSQAHAQGEVQVFLDSTAQTIRGFGAANIVGWRPDMTDAEIETAFGVEEGQLGFSLLRLRIPPGQNNWNVNLSTARKAHERGVTLIASPWSPPAAMKTNNNLVGGRLRDDMYEAYATYLDDFSSFMADNGAPLYGVSVQNEPDIQVSYESCDWSPTEMTRFMRENAASIDNRVIAPESFQFRRAMSDPILLDPEAVDNLDIVGGHVYGGGLASYPLAVEKGKEVWMTEHLDLDTDFEASLGTAVEIQNAMRFGMSAYIWWYIVRYYGPISDGEEGPYAKGEVTKRGYMMSQFSRFIRPGAVRLHTMGPVRLFGTSATAYRDGSTVVVVAVNDAPESRDIRFTFQGGEVGAGEQFVTSETQNVERLEDVEPTDNQLTVTLAANSVATFVLDHTPLSSEEEPSGRSHRLLQNFPNPSSTSTSIGYELTRPEEVRLEVFDLLGRRVATLVDGSVSAGVHRVDYPTDRLPPGVYTYRLRAGDVRQTRMMTVVR